MMITNVGIGDIEAIKHFFDKVVRSDYPTVRENYFQWQFIESEQIFGEGTAGKKIAAHLEIADLKIIKRCTY
jgi:hypothetical protein